MTQAPSVPTEATIVTAARLLNGDSCSRNTFVTKAQNQESEDPAAQEASGSSKEQGADAEQQTADPKDQLLAEKNQQV